MRISDWSSDVCSSDLRHSRRYRGMPRCPRRPVSRRESRQARHPAGLRACAKPDNMVSYGKAGRQERMMRGLAGKSVLVTGGGSGIGRARSAEHTSELQSLMRLSYDVFCLEKKKKNTYM